MSRVTLAEAWPHMEYTDIHWRSCPEELKVQAETGTILTCCFYGRPKDALRKQMNYTFLVYNEDILR